MHKTMVGCIGILHAQLIPNANTSIYPPSILDDDAGYIHIWALFAFYIEKGQCNQTCIDAWMCRFEQILIIYYQQN